MTGPPFSIGLLGLILVFTFLNILEAFEVNLIVGKDAEASGVSATGEDIHVITDLERATFGLNEVQLKDMLAVVEGKKPDGALPFYPDLFGDVLPLNERIPLNVVVRPQSAKILEVTTIPLILKRQICDNIQHNKTTECELSMTLDETTTVEDNWSKTDTISGSKSITITATLPPFGEAESSITLSYTHEWQKGGIKSQSVTLGTSDAGKVQVPAGGISTAILSSTIGEMKVQVTFQAKLEGFIYYWYDDRYLGHYFWREDIRALTENLTQIITQDIEVHYYTDSTIKVIDIHLKASEGQDEESELFDVEENEFMEANIQDEPVNVQDSLILNVVDEISSAVGAGVDVVDVASDQLSGIVQAVQQIWPLN